MIPVITEFSGMAQMQAGLGSIDSRLNSLRPLWERFGQEFYEEERQLFESEPWTPLSPAYALRKQKIFGSKSILRATDALFNSLTKQGATGNIHRITDDEAQFGSSDFKAMLHHTGAGRLPRRSPFAKPNAERYANIASEYMLEVLSSAGFN